MGWQADDLPPSSLPYSVIGDAPIQMGAIILVDVVTVNRVELLLHRKRWCRVIPEGRGVLRGLGE